MTIELYQDDLPGDHPFTATDAIAVDTETMGLKTHRDRLCLVQLSGGDGNAVLVQFSAGRYDAPNLKALLGETSVQKIYHYARFDLAAIRKYLGVWAEPVFCTKIASKLVRTYTDRHGLKDLCKELLDVDLSKEKQSSDWGAGELTAAQQAYAACDVLYLHRLRDRLNTRLEREHRRELAEACFGFLRARAELDLAGWPDEDIFAH